MPLVHVDADQASERLILAGTADTLAIDTEGNATDVRPSFFGGQANPNGYTMGVSLAYRPRIDSTYGKAGTLLSDYHPFRHKYGNLDESHLQRMRALIEGFEGRIIMHNAKHDIAALRNLGIEVPQNKLFCTMLGVTWVNEELPSKSLDYASKHYGGKPKNRSEAMQDIIDAWGWGYVPPEIMYEYAANDAHITHELDEAIYPTFVAEGYEGDLWEREREFIRVMMKMESLGVGVNQDVCEKEIYTGEIIMSEIRGILKANPGSPKDLERIIHGELNVPVLHRTDTGRPSFNKTAMEDYEAILENRGDETAKLVLEYRGWQKTVSSNYKAYLDLLSPDGNLRPNYKLHGTRTGRLSCEKPNLQQIPRVSAKPWNGQLKKCFTARPGYTLWECDYGQLEMRLATVYSLDPVLLEVFNRGIDFFNDMQERMPGWERHVLKTNTYATLYGAGARKIGLILGLDEEVALQLRQDFYRSYPGLRISSQRAGAKARARGWVKLWTGRRRHFADVQSGTHKAFNSIIQGGAAEIVKSVILALDKVIDWDECRMCLQIHDSVVFEIADGYAHKWLPIIKEVMENVVELNSCFGDVPFPIDTHVFGQAA